MGFDYFYGFVGGDTSQWQPNLFRNTTAIYPFLNNPSWNLETAMADDAIHYIKQLKEIAPSKPWFVYYVPGATHAPHHPTSEWIKKISAMHLFDGGGMGALGAIVLRHCIDAVAFVQVFLLHAGHVVLHDLRRIGHALRADRRRLHGKGKPDGGRQGGSGKQLMFHDFLLWRLEVRSTAGGSMDMGERLPGREKILFYRAGRCGCN
jgi:hypothetical protein